MQERLDGDGGDDFVERSMWLHLSLLYEAPWRPTFALMDERPASAGDEGTIPLKLVHSGTVEARLHGPVYYTLWEVIQLIGSRDDGISISCLKLAASPLLGGTPVQLWKQRVKDFGCGDILVWAGIEPEAEMRAEAVARARAKRARGRAIVRRPRAPADGEDADGEAAAAEEAEIFAIEDELFAEFSDGEVDLEDEAVPRLFDLPPDHIAPGADDAADPGDAAAAHALAVELGLSSASEKADDEASEGLSDDSAKGEAVRLRIPVEGARKTGRIHITHLGARQEMYAQCPLVELHGHECRRTRTCRAGARQATGRPLGSLVAWMQCGSLCPDRASHMRFNPTKEHREAGRSLAKEQDQGQTFLDFERPKRDGEGSEPDMCP